MWRKSDHGALLQLIEQNSTEMTELLLLVLACVTTLTAGKLVLQEYSILLSRKQFNFIFFTYFCAGSYLTINFNAYPFLKLRLTLGETLRNVFFAYKFLRSIQLL